MIKAVTILLSFIFLFSQKTQGASANSFSSQGCICDSLLHTHTYIYIYIYTFYPLFLIFFIMESLSDIACGRVYCLLNFYHILYWDFNFLFLLNFLGFILNVSADVLLP